MMANEGRSPMIGWIESLLANAGAAPEVKQIAGANVETWCNLGYLIAAILLVFGVFGVSRCGSRFGVATTALGLVIATVAAFMNLHSLNRVEMLQSAVGGVAVCAIIGMALASRAQLSPAPKFAALLTLFAGLSAALVAAADVRANPTPSLQTCIANALAGALGATAFGAGIATYGKLSAWSPFVALDRLVIRPPLSLALGAGAAAVTAWLVVEMRGENANPAEYIWHYAGLAALAASLGLFLLGAVFTANPERAIALLAALCGLATAAVGMAFDNSIAIIAGALAAGMAIGLPRRS